MLSRFSQIFVFKRYYISTSPSVCQSNKIAIFVSKRQGSGVGLGNKLNILNKYSPWNICCYCWNILKYRISYRLENAWSIAVNNLNPIEYCSLPIGFIFWLIMWSDFVSSLTLTEPDSQFCLASANLLECVRFNAKKSTCQYVAFSFRCPGFNVNVYYNTSNTS